MICVRYDTTAEPWYIIEVSIETMLKTYILLYNIFL